MTSKDISSELNRQAFVPFRLHLVSGKEIDVTMAAAAWMLQNAILVMKDPKGEKSDKYDMIALRNIERLEQIEAD